MVGTRSKTRIYVCLRTPGTPNTVSRYINHNRLCLPVPAKSTVPSVPAVPGERGYVPTVPGVLAVSEGEGFVPTMPGVLAVSDFGNPCPKQQLISI